MKHTKHIEERIELYLSDKLSHQEIEELWVDILKNPIYLDVLKVNVGLREMCSKKTTWNEWITWTKKTWLSGAAAIFVIGLFLNIILYPSVPSTFAITHIDLYEVEVPSGLRSGIEDFESGDFIMHIAFDAMVSDDKVLANDLYDKILNNSKYEAYHAQALFNKGIIFYNNKAFDMAVVVFHSALKLEQGNTEFLEKSYWYLGNTYLHLKAVSEARWKVGKAYELDGRHKSQAGTLLYTLNKIYD